MKWINAHEVVPDNIRPVLFVVKGSIDIHPKFGYFEDSEFKEPTGIGWRYYSYKDVTHWCYLPSLPND